MIAETGQPHDVAQAWGPERERAQPSEEFFPAHVDSAPAAASQEWRITQLARYLFGFSRLARIDDPSLRQSVVQPRGADSSGGDMSSEAVSDAGSTGDSPSVEVWEGWEELGETSCELLRSQARAPVDTQQDDELPRDDSWMRVSQMLPPPEGDTSRRSLAKSVLEKADHLLEGTNITDGRTSLNLSTILFHDHFADKAAEAVDGSDHAAADDLLADATFLDIGDDFEAVLEGDDISLRRKEMEKPVSKQERMERVIGVLKAFQDFKVCVAVTIVVVASIALSMGVLNFVILLVQIPLSFSAGLSGTSLFLYSLLQGITNLDRIHVLLKRNMDYILITQPQATRRPNTPQLVAKVERCKAKIDEMYQKLNSLKKKSSLFIVPTLVFLSTSIMAMQGALIAPLGFFLLFMIAGSATGVWVNSKLEKKTNILLKSEQFEKKARDLLKYIDWYHTVYNWTFGWFRGGEESRPPEAASDR